jgi:S-DNA-T family DNA segregation ATPase FtsK/SpoIIIE
VEVKEELVVIFEILTTGIMGAIAVKAFVKKNGLATNDSGKIQRIFSLSGLNVKDGKDTLTTQLIKKKEYPWGWEYKYRIPLGRSFDDYINKQRTLEDGLNNRKKKITIGDLKSLQLDENIIENVKELWTNKLVKRKELELSFDGLLILKIYNEPLPTKIDWKPEDLKKNTWSVLIGSNRNGEVYHDFDKRKHLIVAGATGGGKSVVMKSIITSLVLSKPNDVTFSLIDLKGGPAFARFKNLKQVVNFGVDNEESLEILKNVQQKMNEDYRKIVDNGHEDVSEAGIRKRHFIVVDEAADLADDKACMAILTDIVRKGRGAGYYIIYATQYPSAQAIPMQIKRNIPARLCFVLDSATASVTVLDGAGAERLPEIPGRGIYKEVKQTILQTPYMSNDVIRELIKPYIVKKEVKPVEEIINSSGRNDTVSFEKM